MATAASGCGLMTDDVCSVAMSRNFDECAGLTCGLRAFNVSCEEATRLGVGLARATCVLCS